MPRCEHCNSPLELLYDDEWSETMDECESVYVCSYCGRHFVEMNGSWLCEDDGEYIE